MRTQITDYVNYMQNEQWIGSSLLSAMYNGYKVSTI